MLKRKLSWDKVGYSLQIQSKTTCCIWWEKNETCIDDNNNYSEQQQQHVDVSIMYRCKVTVVVVYLNFPDAKARKLETEAHKQTFQLLPPPPTVTFFHAKHPR